MIQKQKTTYDLITFKNTTAAMLFEKLAKIEDISGRLIPLPKQIDAGCGLAFWYKCDKEICLKVLDENDIEYDKICEVTF